MWFYTIRQKRWYNYTFTAFICSKKKKTEQFEFLLSVVVHADLSFFLFYYLFRDNFPQKIFHFRHLYMMDIRSENLDATFQFFFLSPLFPVIVKFIVPDIPCVRSRSQISNSGLLVYSSI